MAAIRALCDMLYGQTWIPDFREQPYDLGGFNDIVHSQRDSTSQGRRFELGLGYLAKSDLPGTCRRCRFDVSFAKDGDAATPDRLRLSNVDHKIWIKFSREEDSHWQASVGTLKGAWQLPPSSVRWDPPNFHFISFSDLTGVPSDTMRQIELLCESTPWNLWGVNVVYARGPVRPRPRRTFAEWDSTPVGRWVPTGSGKKGNWDTLKKDLDRFGADSGLFYEIDTGLVGPRSGSVTIKEAGSLRNLADVGYGVSQALPVVSDLLRDRPVDVGRDVEIHLLDQPDVHLHPRAQAALGSLFCRVARPDKMLIVETHSDCLLDRIRMDLRDGKTDLRPQDVSILYFERINQAVRIHHLELDKKGYIVDAPRSYRQSLAKVTELMRTRVRPA